MPLMEDGSGNLFVEGDSLVVVSEGEICCCEEYTACSCCIYPIPELWMIVNGLGSDQCDCSAANGTFHIVTNQIDGCSGSVESDVVTCDCNGASTPEPVQYNWFITCSPEGATQTKVTMTVEIRGSVFCFGVYEIPSGLGFTGYRSVTVDNTEFPIDCQAYFEGTYTADIPSSEDPADSAGCDRPGSVDISFSEPVP